MSTSSFLRNRYRFTGRSAIAIAATAVVLVATACSSSSKSSTSSSGSSTAAAVKFTQSGVLKFGDITSIGNAINDLPGALAGVKAAIRAINLKGGIGGHEVELDYCNDNSDTNQAGACARKLVSDGVIAETGDGIMNAVLDPIFLAAGIPQVGILPVAAGDFTNPNVYLLESGPTSASNAAVAYFAQTGGKKIFLANTDVPTLANAPAKLAAVAAKNNLTVAGHVATPPTATDLSSYVVQAQKSGADGVELLYDAPGVVTFLQAAQQLGVTSNIKYVFPGTNFTQTQVEKLGSEAPNVYYGQAVPPIASANEVPGLKLFLADMKAEEASGDKYAATSYIGQGTMEGWMAVYAVFKSVAKDTPTVTAKTVMDALNAATNIDFGGMIPPWTPNKPGPTGTPRVSNTAMWIVKVQGTTPVLAMDKTIDTSTIQ